MDVDARARIDLPEHVPATFDVYVNGVRQEPGRDYEVVWLEAPSTIGGRTLLFARPLAQEGRLGFWRWASMWLGIAGTYRRHESVDLVYEEGGRRQVETGLRPQPVD